MALLEREADLAVARRVIRGGGVLVIEGGAGIGKTSLLNAACERAARSGHDVLRARGFELEAGFAFGLVRQLFERRIAQTDLTEREALFAGAAAAARPLLTGEGSTASATDTSFAVIHGLYWAAANLAASRPMVLAVDDAHWADRPSLRWLAYLAPRLNGLPISLLVSLRPAEAAADAEPLQTMRSQAIVVRPKLLSQSAVANVVRTTRGRDASDEVCAAAWHQSGGNPFYLHELLRAPKAGHGLSRQVAARVRRLNPQALRFAQVLAVLGDDCELRHAATIARVEAETAESLVAGLLRLEVLASADPLRFLHPVVREAVEASMASDAADSAHRQAAHLLHAEAAQPGRIAAHLLRTRPHGDPWVVERLRDAAAVAIDSGAPGSGADLLVRALSEPPSADERVPLLREAAAAEILAGRESACHRLEEALELAADPRLHAEIGLELAEANASLFRWANAVDVCERVLDELDETVEELQVELEAEMVICGLRDARRAARVLPVLERLGARPLELRPADAYAIARAQAALTMFGRPAQEIVRLIEPSLDHAGPPAGNWDAALPALVLLIIAEGYGIAEAALDRMLEEVRRSGSARGLFTTHLSLALLKLRLGALPEAEEAARIAERVFTAADLGHGQPLLASTLADTLIEAGRLTDAQQQLEHLPSSGRLTPAINVVNIPAARGRLYLAQGRAREALREFEASASLLSRQRWGMEMHDNGLTHARSGAALALLQLGEIKQARELAESELADARVHRAPRALGVALRVAGLAAGRDQALELLEESAKVLETSPARLERAHSLADLGAALRRAGRRSDAREPLADALELAARCGARPLATRIGEELRAAGARPRREWRTGVQALTASELRVARMAAEGRTNREIAQALFVTLKTVEGHLARAFDKLDISSRSELRQGLEGEKTRVPTP